MAISFPAPLCKVATARETPTKKRSKISKTPSAYTWKIAWPNHAHCCPTRTNKGPRSVSVRDADAHRVGGERHEPACRRRPEHACASALVDRLDRGAGRERLVRRRYHRSV